MLDPIETLVDKGNPPSNVVLLSADLTVEGAIELAKSVTSSKIVFVAPDVSIEAASVFVINVKTGRLRLMITPNLSVDLLQALIPLLPVGSEIQIEKHVSKDLAIAATLALPSNLRIRIAGDFPRLSAMETARKLLPGRVFMLPPDINEADALAVVKLLSIGTILSLPESISPSLASQITQIVKKGVVLHLMPSIGESAAQAAVAGMQVSQSLILDPSLPIGLGTIIGNSLPMGASVIITPNINLELVKAMVRDLKANTIVKLVATLVDTEVAAVAETMKEIAVGVKVCIPSPISFASADTIAKSMTAGTILVLPNIVEEDLAVRLLTNFLFKAYAPRIVLHPTTSVEKRQAILAAVKVACAVRQSSAQQAAELGIFEQRRAKRKVADAPEESEENPNAKLKAPSPGPA